MFWNQKVKNCARKASELSRNQRLLGLTAGTKWTIWDTMNNRGLASRLLRVHPKALRYPVFVRTGRSSDMDLFRNIFVLGELDFWRDCVQSPEGILDLGANVGYVSALFLSLFPRASVLAVEPDPANAQMCRLNLSPYGARARVLEGAVWHRCGHLSLSRGVFGDGREWATQVTEVSTKDSADVTGWDMPTLLAIWGRKRIDILKIDIEGSEQALFSKSTGEWLPHVRNICIETHGALCEQTVRSALSPYDFRESRTGEYLLFLDMQSLPDVTSPARVLRSH